MLFLSISSASEMPLRLVFFKSNFMADGHVVSILRWIDKFWIFSLIALFLELYETLIITEVFLLSMVSSSAFVSLFDSYLEQFDI